LKNTIATILLAVSFLTSVAQNDSPDFVTYDIDNFWAAYDNIVSARDSAEKYALINRMYIDKGSPGLQAMMQARQYTAKSYIDAIEAQPLFWASVRPNTYKAKGLAKEIENGAIKLKQLYPGLKPAKVYFTIGAFRSNGTTMDGMILIGSELAMADEETVSSEFPEKLGHLKTYFKTNPIKEIVFLNVHEYVHTQQKTAGGYDLLSQSLYEGIAEFLPTLALEKASPTPAIDYGKSNDKTVKDAFEKEMFSPWIYNWIWNTADNPFNIRDLGYYVGYAIAEKYYEQSEDKKMAIKTLIELDYNKPDEIERFIDKTTYFSQPINQLKTAYEKSRPVVTGISEFKNGSQKVDPALNQLTIHFSQKMDKRFRSLDFGKLGKDHFPEILSAEFANDGMSIIYQVKLQAGKQYQFVIEEGFRTEKATPLKAYTVNIKTTGK
jgi:hypothetical protein